MGLGSSVDKSTASSRKSKTLINQKKVNYLEILSMLFNRKFLEFKLRIRLKLCSRKIFANDVDRQTIFTYPAVRYVQPRTRVMRHTEVKLIKLSFLFIARLMMFVKSLYGDMIFLHGVTSYITQPRGRIALHAARDVTGVEFLDPVAHLS